MLPYRTLHFRNNLSMTELLLFIFVAECVALLAWGLSKQSRVLMLPTLAAAVFAGWMLPQFVGLAQRPPFGDEAALQKTIAFAILCQAAISLAYLQPISSGRIKERELDIIRLSAGSLALMVFGLFFYMKMLGLQDEANAAAELNHTGWSGPITIYALLAKAVTVAFGVAFVCYLKRPNLAAYSTLLIGGIVFVERILISGRRAALIELILIVVYGLLFIRRWSLPRVLVLGGLMAGALIVNSVGTYRGLMLVDTDAAFSSRVWHALTNIDFTENLVNISIGATEPYELLNATATVGSVAPLRDLDLGLSLWNSIVHSYIPGQLVGADLKEALKLRLPNPAQQVYSHIPHPGATHTGLADAFQSFWYFGAVLFWLIGKTQKYWTVQAARGQLSALLMVMLSTSAALHSITHTSHHFWLELPLLFAFLFPVLHFARRARTPIAFEQRGIRA